jgi:hypothetical protein
MSCTDVEARTIKFPLPEPDIYSAEWPAIDGPYTLHCEVWPAELRHECQHPTAMSADGTKAFTWYRVNRLGAITYPVSQAGPGTSETGFRVAR